MTRETLCEEIVSGFYRLLPSAEPDCFDIYQHHYKTALAIWDAKTPGECVDVLINGKWRDRELKRFINQLTIWESMAKDLE